MGLRSRILRMKVLIFVSALAFVFTSAEFYCGQPLKDRRIIGGDPAKPFQFPWQVVLYYANYKNALSCGGTIISSRTILTAGWGYTENDVIPDELMVANVTTMPNKECQEAYFPAVIDSSMICAAHPGKDTCQGDSGGPLMTLRQEEAYYVQIGVTSWGYGCARDHPGVYSRVTDQLYWIFSKMTGKTLPTPVARTMDN